MPPEGRSLQIYKMLTLDITKFAEQLKAVPKATAKDLTEDERRMRRTLVEVEKMHLGIGHWGTFTAEELEELFDSYYHEANNTEALEHDIAEAAQILVVIKKAKPGGDTDVVFI